MIRTFKNRALSRLWHSDDASKIRPDQVERIKGRLAALDRAKRPTALNIPGFDFHKLRGQERWTIHVNGPWCITFEWDGDDAVRVDLEQYH
jgi:proteic killer suppression protein